MSARCPRRTGITSNERSEGEEPAAGIHEQKSNPYSRTKQDILDVAEFIDATESAFQLLVNPPGVGVVREFSVETLKGIRTWPVRDFDKVLIFYLDIPEGIQVIRVLHRARDIPSVLSEELECDAPGE